MSFVSVIIILIGATIGCLVYVEKHGSRWEKLVKISKSYREIQNIVVTLCQAAEQLGITNKWSSNDKKEYVIQALKKIDSVSKLFSESEIEAIVESAIYSVIDPPNLKNVIIDKEDTKK